MQPEPMTYTPTARLLHWITAALVLLMIPLGVAAAKGDFGPAQDIIYHLHRSFGVVLLWVVAARLIYRISHSPPPLPADVPSWQASVARLTHVLLYAVLTAQLLVGWIATSAYRAPIRVFWLFEWPPIWPENRAFSDQMFVVHAILGFTLAGLVALHVGAALYHHFVLRDRVLTRMVSG